MFTSQPQDVEVYQAGAWWPGALLGWRHDGDGGCQVWVRVVLDGVEETAWTDLATLRLPERRPERHLSLAPQPEATQQLPAQAPAVTARNHPLVRNLTAPDYSATQSLGGLRARPQAPAAATRPSGGGRRRAPETGEMPAAAVLPTVAAVPMATLAGRHRASAGPGRHRAADTGMLPAVADAVPVRREPDHELLTRPMRLGDLGPKSRTPRPDGQLRHA